MTKVDEVVLESPAKRVRTVESVGIGDGLFVYRYYDNLQIADGSSDAIHLGDREAIVTEKELKKLKAGKKWVDFAPTTKSKFEPLPILITAAGREALRTGGNPFQHTELWKQLEKSGEVASSKKGERRHLLEAAKNGATTKDLIFMDPYDHQILEVNGAPVMMALDFSFETVSEENFDLLKAGAHLKAKEGFVLLGKNGVPVQNEKLAIHWSGIGNYLAAKWIPTEETWGKAVKEVLPLVGTMHFNRMFYSRQLAVEHDYFGLVAAGCLQENKPESDDDFDYDRLERPRIR